MKVVNLYEAKTHLSKLVASLESGEDRIVLCRNGKPVADMVAHTRSHSTRQSPHPELAGARFKGDPCAPLDESDWPEALR